MASLGLDNLVHQSLNLEILTSPQVQEIWTSLGTQNVTTDEFLGEAVRKGFLTSYQSERLKRGETTGFYFGDYKVLYHIGSGTFARVYRATHKTTGKIVALKVLRSNFDNDPGVINHFIHEAELGIELRHPNIVPIYEVQSHPGEHFMVMDFIEGQTLRELLRMRQKIEPKVATKLVTDICSGLDYAARRHLQHRDLKLSNVLLSNNNGRAMLVDFGLATIAENSTFGDTEIRNQRSIDYAALERITGVERDDSRSDIYFLGCIFYHLLTGEPALLETKDRAKRANKNRFTSVKPIQNVDPLIPRAVVLVVNKAMSLDVEKRYQTMTELGLDLEVCAKRLTEGTANDGIVTTQIDTGLARMAANASREKQRSVMIVDADIKLQEVFRESLKKAGYRVLVASSSERAVDRLFDDITVANLVIFNIQSLGASGVEGWTRLAKDSYSAKLPSIMLLDERQNGLIANVETDDIHTILTLPIKMKELKAHISQLLIRAEEAAMPSEPFTPKFELQMNLLESLNLLPETGSEEPATDEYVEVEDDEFDDEEIDEPSDVHSYQTTADYKEILAEAKNEEDSFADALFDAHVPSMIRTQGESSDPDLQEETQDYEEYSEPEVQEETQEYQYSESDPQEATQEYQLPTEQETQEYQYSESDSQEATQEYQLPTEQETQEYQYPESDSQEATQEYQLPTEQETQEYQYSESESQEETQEYQYSDANVDSEEETQEYQKQSDLETREYQHSEPESESDEKTQESPESSETESETVLEPQEEIKALLESAQSLEEIQAILDNTKSRLEETIRSENETVEQLAALAGRKKEAQDTFHATQEQLNEKQQQVESAQNSIAELSAVVESASIQESEMLQMLEEAAKTKERTSFEHLSIKENLEQTHSELEQQQEAHQKTQEQVQQIQTAAESGEELHVQIEEIQKILEEAQANLERVQNDSEHALNVAGEARVNAEQIAEKLATLTAAHAESSETAQSAKAESEAAATIIEELKSTSEELQQKAEAALQSAVEKETLAVELEEEARKAKERAELARKEAEEVMNAAGEAQIEADAAVEEFHAAEQFAQETAQNAEQANAKAEEHQKTLQELQEQHEQHSREADQHEENAVNLAVELERITEECNATRQLLEETQAAHASTLTGKEDLPQLHESLQQLAAEVERLQQTAKMTQEDMDKIALESQEAEVLEEELRKEIENIREEAEEAKTRTAEATTLAEQTQKELDEVLQRQKSVEVEMQSLEEQESDLNRLSQKHAAEREAIQRAIEDAEKALADFKAAHSETETEETSETTTVETEEPQPSEEAAKEEPTEEKAVEEKAEDQLTADKADTSNNAIVDSVAAKIRARVEAALAARKK